MRNILKKVKKFIIKHLYLSSGIIIAVFALCSSATYVGYKTLHSLSSSNPNQTSLSQKNQKTSPKKELVEQSVPSAVTTAPDPAAPTQSAQPSTSPNPTPPSKPQAIPPGMKKVPTSAEQQVMNACMQRDATAYAKFYNNITAENQRHQAALNAINAAYNGSNRYEDVYYSGDEATNLYNADIAEENARFQQTTTELNATYEAERSPTQC